MNENKTYICIDLKSFYASVECVLRGLDPLSTNLVVADSSRTEKTICLAVSPSLKAYGIPGRARLFEVVQKVKEVNRARKRKCPYPDFLGESTSATILAKSPELSLSYIAATPRMAKYIEISSKIYSIYLKYIAPEDIHVYSIDEVFMDVTNYLKNYHKSAHELAMVMIQDVLKNTGITATAGIGTNMYLAKVAMDIVAKHIPADKDGVRIAQLDEQSYRKQLWAHQPLKDFWRVGAGYVRRLEALGLYTMGDIARCSLGSKDDYYNEDLLYKEFGINAELLIDHAWGYEPTRMQDIKNYKPASNSISSGQVIHCGYDYEKAKILVMEMMDDLSLDLVHKKLMTNQIGLAIGYDIENLTDPNIKDQYKGKIETDWYGRKVPKAAHSSINLERFTSSTTLLVSAIVKLYDKIVDKNLLVRRLNISANNLVDENTASKFNSADEQLSLFVDYDQKKKREEKLSQELEKEKRVQEALLSIKKKYGKNSILKANDYEEGATGIDRNNQIGGHKA